MAQYLISEETDVSVLSMRSYADVGVPAQNTGAWSERLSDFDQLETRMNEPLVELTQADR